ncbi:hypothetical protein Enr13x_17700 [Stieleria neptunia]|uniref:Uncharacterized protein n=1 Tax=Stieleria neptunia TaxID=2527979 RepID=A0A518HMC6_9BACT|nr:hypothetical protein Enr13x_17700 [Stieleria neptunia]
MSEWVLDDNRSVQTPLRRRGPVEGTKHLRRIADQVIPRRVAPPQSPSPLQLASPSDRTEPSDIAVIPQKTFPEYPRAATKIREEPLVREASAWHRPMPLTLTPSGMSLLAVLGASPPVFHAETGRLAPFR